MVFSRADNGQRDDFVFSRLGLNCANCCRNFEGKQSAEATLSPLDAVISTACAQPFMRFKSNLPDIDLLSPSLDDISSLSVFQ